jgi:Protein of unknown function (DUF2490)
MPPPSISPRRRSTRLWQPGIFLTIFLALAPLPASAQTAPKWPPKDFQGWTDFEILHKLAPHSDLNLNGGLRWGEDEGHLVYRRVGAAFDLKPWKYLSISPAYAFYSTDSTPSARAHENRISLAGTVGVPFRFWTIRDRNLVEKRYLTSGAPWRYRNRLELEGPVRLGHRSFKAVVWDEVYYDSAAKGWTRNRAAIGGEREVLPRLRLGLYFIHQNDGHTRPGDLNALAMTIRAKF